MSPFLNRRLTHCSTCLPKALLHSHSSLLVTPPFFLLPPAFTYMSQTHCARANSPSRTGQATATFSSRPQATNATPPAPAKSQSQHIKYEVPLLDNNGDDYTHWCKMVTLVLEHRGFWDVVDGSTPTPDPVTDTQANVDWCRCDKEAQIQLLLALSRAPCNHVLDAKTSKEI